VHAERERNERDRRRQRESAPRGERSEHARALVADGDADLTAGGTRQKLAERHDRRVASFIEPSPSADELVAKIADVRDGAAE
jgi:hypothetical protein